jgi:DNA end-binding protein Ku
VARPLWVGALSFGLVNVPVALYRGVRDRDVHFRQLHGNDGAPIEVRRFCSREGAEVPPEEIGHGYDLDGKHVVLTDEELTAAQPRKTRTIEIQAFVDLGEVDPIYFDHPYVLAPSGEIEGIKRAYRLLVEVMARADRAALGRIVMRAREYLVLIRARDDRLILTTMLFHDELRPTGGITTGDTEPTREELEQAVALIEALSVDWNPDRYEDRHRERLRRLIEHKELGERVSASRQEKRPRPVPDLMAALERTLADTTGGAARSGVTPTARPGPDARRHRP